MNAGDKLSAAVAPSMLPLLGASRTTSTSNGTASELVTVQLLAPTITTPPGITQLTSASPNTAETLELFLVSKL